MDWLNASDGRIETNVSLADLTWFGLGGAAACVVHPRDEAHLSDLVRRASERNIPLRVLGGGANLLVCDAGVDGIVVRLTEPSFTAVEFDGTVAAAGAGADLTRFVKDCVGRGLAGLEGLAGIPGTVGGAVRMNAGGRYGEIQSSVIEARVVLPSGQVETWPHERLGFGYRHSGLGGAIVVSARFQLTAEDPDALRARFQEYWRAKKESQPLAAHSAGCIFRNPPGEMAGRLIDRAGLKGRSVGRARVSERHANFIVAEEGATATDVLRLVEEIRCTVREKFGIQLETEIEIWEPDRQTCPV